jgi:regulator of cell morphogenesis and NO signaling
MALIQIEQRNTPRFLDVRDIAPRERHPLIFDTFEKLAPADAFVLVNDHDPKPLYYQFMAEQPGKVGWTYLEQGPEVWQVRITRLHDLAATPIMVLVADHPQLKPVLDEHGLDTCCGGHFTVTEAAAEHGIDPAPVLDALRRHL